MGYFAPTFENPYPSPGWEEISHFEYLTPLRLYRDAKNGPKRDGEDTDYVLSDDYRVRYRLDGEAREITVPAGMLTDLVSVPWFARWLVDRVGPCLEAAIVHDFLYIAWQDVAGRGARQEDRRFADELMRAAMATAGVGATVCFVIHSAVRIFGRGAFEEFDARRYWRADVRALAVVTDRAA
jgi:hypothetical protein